MKGFKLVKVKPIYGSTCRQCDLDQDDRCDVSKCWNDDAGSEHHVFKRKRKKKKKKKIKKAWK